MSWWLPALFTHPINGQPARVGTPAPPQRPCDHSEELNLGGPNPVSRWNIWIIYLSYPTG